MSDRESFGRIEAEYGEVENGLTVDVAAPTYLLAPNTEEKVIWICSKRYFVDDFIGKALGGDRGDLWISRTGLWPDRMIEWVSLMAADKPIFYLGDLDGFDIAIYWDLHQALIERGKKLQYWGVDSAWLEIASLCSKRKTLGSQVFDAPKGELVLAEAMFAAHPVTEKIIGDSAAALLRSGKKIELEALVSNSFFEDGYWSELKKMSDDKMTTLVSAVD